MSDFSKFAVGDQVYVGSRGYRGLNVSGPYEIIRETSTQWVVGDSENSGDGRFRKVDLRQVGGGHYSPRRMYAVDNPSVIQSLKDRRDYRALMLMQDALYDGVAKRNSVPSVEVVQEAIATLQGYLEYLTSEGES